MTLKHNYGQPINTESVNFTEEQHRRLKELFPEIFTEKDKIDWEKFRETLGEFVDDKPERYSFGWAGKKDAIRILQAPTSATLVPIPKEAVNFDTTQNIFIEGDNLEVLKLLYKSYFGQVKLIYIDPPYNTGNDFIYPDNYRDPLSHYLKISGQKDNQGNLLTSNVNTNGRFHSSWLSMMYPRLFLARQLLEESGLIFISIDDNELSNLIALMNQVFGEENRLAVVAWEKRFTRSNNARLFASVKDSIVVYRKSGTLSYLRDERTEKSDSIYHNPDKDSRGAWTSVSYVNPATKEQRPNLVYKIKNPFSGKKIEHPTNAWKYEHSQYLKHVEEGRLYWGKEGKHKYPRLKKFLSEVSDGIVPVDVWPHKESGTTDEGTKELEAILGKDIFDNPKPVRLIKRMLKIVTEKNEMAIVLDFFAGSATTAQAVLELNREDNGNRRFIMVQLPEPTNIQSGAYRAGYKTIADIGKERIRRVIAKMKKEQKAAEDLGFKVLKLAESNFKSWRGAKEDKPKEYFKEMEMFVDPLRPGWKKDDVIFEIAIKEGFGLNIKREKITDVAANTVYKVTDPDKAQSFYICLDNSLAIEAIKPLNLTRNHTFICRDVALSDETAANLALQCRLKTI